MSHHFESGFFVREQAWHGLGIVLDDAPSVDDAITVAGLDWQVQDAPLTLEDGTPVPSHKALIRSTDQNVLGVVGSRYEALQNADAFRWFDPLIVDGTCRFEAAGSLKGGSRVWILARIGDDDGRVLGEDIVTPYLLLSNAHDGSRAVTVSFTPIRVVCWNTLTAAHARADAKGGDTAVRVRHTASMHETLKAVRDAVDLAQQTFRVSLDQWRAMQRRKITADGLDDYIARTFASDAVIAAAEAAQSEIPQPRFRDKVVELFETGPGAELAGSTVWGAYNAVTHYLDHHRGRTTDAKLDHAWYNTATRQTRERAERLALALV